MTGLHVVVPDAFDDPARPSGGNTYDRRVCEELSRSGWSVRVHPVPGSWPHPDAVALDALAARVDAVPDGAVVLLDGLVASAAATVLVPRAERVRMAVLVHMPLGGGGDEPVQAGEQAVLGRSAVVIATSEWTKRRLRELYGLPPERITVAHPGVDPAGPAPGTAGGGSLLCVGAVTHLKGHDLLVDALTRLPGGGWRCRCIGSLDREPEVVARLRADVEAAGLGDRIVLAGVCSDAAVDRAYRSADLLVHPSRAETYGMVVTEALARGLPVVAGDVGGVPEAMGFDAGGLRPGMLVPPADAAALAGAIDRWLGSDALRARLRQGAAERRSTLSPWSATARIVAHACEAAAA